MSMDYCVCEGIKNTNMSEIDQFALIYDVICEYGVHMDTRFEDHPWLSSPAGIEIIKAIGLFHVHGHKEECLHRFATTYIPGLAIVDGEILETLWSILNKVARANRGASIAHRAEVLDDHMGDSNWKKTINMGNVIQCISARKLMFMKAYTILGKYQRAVKEQAEVSRYFQGLTEYCPRDLLPIWKRDIEQAEAGRQLDVTKMDYMNLKVDKRSVSYAPDILTLILNIALTLREIELKLSQEEFEEGGQTGQASWISKGLKIEESQ